jgi:hypothetical protein
MLCHSEPVNQVDYGGSEFWREVCQGCGIWWREGVYSWNAWEVLKGDLQIKYTTEHTLVLKDNKGGVAVIEFLSPNLPNKGFGYRLCPDGNQGLHFDALYKSVAELCGAIAGAQHSTDDHY